MKGTPDMATAIFNRPAPPRLPFELQLIVAENCPDVPTLLALVSAHKTLRERGARLAVQLPNARVALHTPAALRSFFEFAAPLRCTEHMPSRLTHLHTLDLTLRIVVDAGSIDGLTTMLAHVRKLTSLTIREPDDALADARLYATLQSLTTLKTLRAFSAGPATRKLFAEVASALEDVALTHNPVPGAAFSDGALELERFLTPHRKTLTRVSASWAMPVDRAVVPTTRALVFFDKVRELVVPGFVWDTAPDFIDAFPDIVSLDVGMDVTAQWSLSPILERARDANKYITGGSEDGESDDEDDDEESDTSDVDAEEHERDHGGKDIEMAERDEISERVEMEVPFGTDERDGVDAHDQADEDDEGDVSDDECPFVWESLESVRGGLLDLYVFGNTCAVNVLTIDGLIKSAWGCVPAVVRDHRPRSLYLAVSSSLDVEAWERDWYKLSTVRDLALMIVVEDLLNEDQLLDTAVRAVTSFTLCQTICLNLVGRNDATSHQLVRFDHPALAHRVFEKSRTTSKICIGTPSGVTIWQPVVDGEGYVRAQPLRFKKANISPESQL